MGMDGVMNRRSTSSLPPCTVRYDDFRPNSPLRYYMRGLVESFLHNLVVCSIY